MVAYNFQQRFERDIAAGYKRQTIRLPRRRHARVGERLQLYVGQRTRGCRLIRDDVTCDGLSEVRFDLRALRDIHEPNSAREVAEIVARAPLSLELNGIPIERPEDRDRFAQDDGFARAGLVSLGCSPFAAMVHFWMWKYGAGLFEGVLIHWDFQR